ncbi:MAG TPA: hypothetical protein VGS41_08810, partial [Chthonomonadales bacterium]|nr:hypothetical protein [Chthonomonadales bacterium]
MMAFVSAMLIAAGGQAGGKLISSFETAAELAAWHGNNAELTLTTRSATEGKHAALAEFRPAEWPNISLKPQQPWDWSGAGGLAIELANPGDEPVWFGIRIDDSLLADGVNHCRTGSATIAAHQAHTYLVPLGPDPMSVGMRGLPADAGMIGAGAQGAGPFNLQHIVAMQIFLHQPQKVTALIVENVRLTAPVSLIGIVDRFGQYTGASWPGKVRSRSELAHRRHLEARELAEQPSLPDTDRYGGWSTGPKERASGFFRTQKVAGKWWFVTPEGHLFFSLGIDCVNEEAATVITGRERMFTWLPSAGSALAAFRGHTSFIHSGPVKEGDTFNFYQANLMRKYGAGWQQSADRTAIDRLRSWGFNTLGNWTDQRYYGKMAYVDTLGIGGSHARVSSGSDYWSTMHDPFDPQFAADVRSSVTAEAAKRRDDPWLLGYFVDNELSWGGWGDDAGRWGLAYGALSAAEGSPAKHALAAQLQQNYGEIAGLNRAWNTGFKDWDALNGPVHLSGPPTAAQKLDF